MADTMPPVMSPGRLPVLTGDPDALSWGGSLLVGAGNEVEHAAAALDRVLVMLDHVWFGVAHDAAVVPIRAVQADMRSLRDGLDTASAVLVSHAAVVEDGVHTLRTLQRELDAGTPVAEVWRRADAVTAEVDSSAELARRRLLAAEASFDRVSLHLGVWLEIVQGLTGVAAAARAWSAMKGWERPAGAVDRAQRSLAAMAQAERRGLLAPWDQSWSGRSADSLVKAMGLSSQDAALVATLVARGVRTLGMFNGVVGDLDKAVTGAGLERVLGGVGAVAAGVVLLTAVTGAFPALAATAAAIALGVAMVKLGAVLFRNRRQVERDLRRAGNWLGDRAGWLGREGGHVGAGIMHRLTGIDGIWGHAGVGW